MDPVAFGENWCCHQDKKCPQSCFLCSTYIRKAPWVESDINLRLMNPAEGEKFSFPPEPSCSRRLRDMEDGMEGSAGRKKLTKMLWYVEFSSEFKQSHKFQWLSSQKWPGCPKAPYCLGNWGTLAIIQDKHFNIPCSLHKQLPLQNLVCCSQRPFPLHFIWCCYQFLHNWIFSETHPYIFIQLYLERVINIF